MFKKVYFYKSVLMESFYYFEALVKTEKKTILELITTECN